MIIDATSGSVLNTSGDILVRVGFHYHHWTNLESLQQDDNSGSFCAATAANKARF
jgi:hypothetical protein